MKVLALDLGERRIGVALSDSAGILASPYAVLDRSGDRSRDHEAIEALLEETSAALLVIGLPLTLRGAEGTAAGSARAEAAEIAARVAVPVELFDERLTTVEAARRRRDRRETAAGRRRGARPRGAAARAGIDSEAAAVLLEAYLAAHRPDPAAGRGQPGERTTGGAEGTTPC